MSARPIQPRVVISSSQRAVRVPRKMIERLAAFVARREGVRLGEVDLAVVGGGEISTLSRRYLGRPGVTDVLSFDLTDRPGRGISAQLVVCGDLAGWRARGLGVSPRRELLLYVVHGLLHLMGHDDATPRGAARMHAREEELLEEFLGGRRRGKKRS